MQFTGKKTQRLRLPRQLCMSEEMAREIERRAERGFRSKEDQVRLLMSLGMMKEDEMARNGQQVSLSHQHSLFSTKEYT
jgi:hypothetical protein